MENTQELLLGHHGQDRELVEISSSMLQNPFKKEERQVAEANSPDLDSWNSKASKVGIKKTLNKKGDAIELQSMDLGHNDQRNSSQPVKGHSDDLV